MLKRSLAALTVLSATLAFAEPQRALLTHENKFPELHELELGAIAGYADYKNFDERALAPYLRFGLIENLTINASVPWRDIESDSNKSESGIGDATLGFELRAYQDILDYPYVIPHVEVAFSTGDEDKGLGSGETVTTVGISVGTVTYDCLHWVADVSYALNGGSERPDPDNVFIFGGSLIWDLSKRFSVLAEANVADEKTEKDDYPVFVQGGLVYKWTDRFVTGAYFGSTHGETYNAEDTAIVKASYTF